MTRHDLPQAHAPIEDELRATEAMFATILSIAADAIITVDESQRVAHFNQGAERIFGYSADEIVGRPLELLMPPRYRGSHATHVMRFARGPDAARRMGERREIYGQRRDGTEFPAEASISRVRTASGWMFSVVLRDITERKQGEDDARFLAEAGSVLAASLDYAETLETVVRLPVPYLADWVVLAVFGEGDEAQRLVADDGEPARRAALARLRGRSMRLWRAEGTDQDALLGRLDVFAPQVDEAWLARQVADADDGELLLALRPTSIAVVRLVAHGRAIGTLTFGLSARAGDDRWYTLARSFASRAALATENARLYRTAQRLTRLRDEILSVVSHDLRNPLSAIAMCTRVLLESPPGDDESRRELLGAIDESTEWMNRLIRDLLDVGNIEAGRLSLERWPIDVSDVVEQATAMFGVTAREQGIALVADEAPGLPHVLADAERVLQVLANLIANALKFTPAGGTVSIETRALDDAVQLRVRDTGPGIPPEHLPFIFDRWWHARRTASKSGSGLGLAIVRGIVEAHGGRIEARSEPGQGATFTFTLPAVRTEDALP